MPIPTAEHTYEIAGGIPVASAWTEVQIVYGDGMVKGQVLACLIGEKAHASDQPPFTLAGEVFERGGHKDLVRAFVPFGSAQARRATGGPQVGCHRPDQPPPAWAPGRDLGAA